MDNWNNDNNWGQDNNLDQNQNNDQNNEFDSDSLEALFGDDSSDNNENQDNHQGSDEGNPMDFMGGENQEEENTGQDFLDNVFQEGNSEDTSSEEDNHNPVENQEYSDEDNVESTDEDEDNDDEELVDIDQFEDDIDGKFLKTPTSAKSVAAFSEKQVYTILNLMTVMEASNEEETGLLGTLFGIRGNNIRKAMALAEKEPQDLEESIITVTALEQIRKSATGEGIEDPMDFAIALFGRIDALTDSQKGSMITLVKSYQDVKGLKRIRVTKKTASADFIKALKDAMTGEESIEELIRDTGTIMESVEKAVK